MHLNSPHGKRSHRASKCKVVEIQTPQMTQMKSKNNNISQNQYGERYLTSTDDRKKVLNDNPNKLQK